MILFYKIFIICTTNLARKCCLISFITLKIGILFILKYYLQAFLIFLIYCFLYQIFSLAQIQFLFDPLHTLSIKFFLFK
jgi:hypothetical protein